MVNKSQTQHRETQNSYATFSTHCNDIVIFKKIKKHDFIFPFKNAGHPMRYNICYSRTSTSWARIEMRKAKKWFHTPNQMNDVKCVMFINVETARTRDKHHTSIATGEISRDERGHLRNGDR